MNIPIKLINNKNKSDIMEKISISTIIVIICICIIGLYAMGEVNYFSSKIAVEKNINEPTILIPKVGITEKINNVSLNQGVLQDPGYYTPNNGDILLFGHRTLQGSPFLRLNEISKGDTLILEWPGVGEVNYTVVNKTIVPATYQLNAKEGGKALYLITCDPIGSTENRLIIEGEKTSQSPINEKVLNENPQASWAWYLSAAFLVLGLLFSLINPKEQRIYIIACVLIISAILFYFCINPIPSEIIYDKINFLNGGM